MAAKPTTQQVAVHNPAWDRNMRSMGLEILFLNISVNYCPQLIKFHSGIDTENLYKISEADPDLIQNFSAICKSLYGRTVVLGGGLRSLSAFLVKKCFP